MFTLILGVLGGILVICSAFLQYYEKKEADLETNKAKKSEEQFRAKAEQLQSRLNNKIFGVAYPKVLVSHSEKDNFFDICLVNESGYDISNVKLLVRNIDNINNCNKRIEGDQLLIDKKCFTENTFVSSDFLIQPGITQQTGYYIANKDGIYHLQLEIFNSYQPVAYLLILKIEANKIIKSYRLYEIKDGNLKFVSEKNDKESYSDEYWNEHFKPDLKKGLIAIP